MLLCVCLNPAVDVTYRLDTPLVPGTSHRVAAVHERAGGKALNVARVAGRLGLPATVLAPVGGDTGEAIRSGLAAAGLPGVLVPIAEPSRRTLAVADPLEATMLNEAGPVLGAAEWQAVREQFELRLSSADLVVLAGSLPPGVPLDAYRVLTDLAARHGVPTIVDAEGEPLRLALAARPWLVKPNRQELAGVTAGAPRSVAEIVAAGHELRRLGAANVVVSNGAEGLVAITQDGVWRAVGPQVTGNPTGAGDALVASLAAGFLHDQPWPERLRDGVARSAAAVAAPVAGELDLATADRLAPAVQVELLPSAPEPASKLEY